MFDGGSCLEAPETIWKKEMVWETTHRDLVRLLYLQSKSLRWVVIGPLGMLSELLAHSFHAEVLQIELQHQE
jgi:hypothetical protein